MACVLEIVTTHCAELDGCSWLLVPCLLSPAPSALQQQQLISLRLASLAPRSDVFPHLVTGSDCAIHSLRLSGVLAS